MNSRKCTVENLSVTRMKREKQSMQNHRTSKKEDKNILSPKGSLKSQNRSILLETVKKGLAFTKVKDKDNCFLEKNKKCENLKFFSETISNSPLLSDISDSDLVVISDACTNSSKETSPEQSDVLMNSPIESKSLNPLKFVSPVKNSSNSQKNLLKDCNETNISPSTSAKQAAIKFKSNICLSSSDRTLDIKENENVTSYESTFSKVNALPEIEFNLASDFSELMQPEWLNSKENSNLNINSPQVDENQLQNSKRHILNNQDDYIFVSSENCLSLLNSTLDVVAEPKEHFISNQLNIESVLKPSDFSYENDSNAFVLAIDSSVLKAANDYLKECSDLAITLIPSPFDVGNMELQNSSSKLSDNAAEVFVLQNVMDEGEVIQFNSEDEPSDINLVSCSTNDIQLEFYDMADEENIGGMEFFSNESHIPLENFENNINEQIYSDMNIGANVVCTNESFEKFSDLKDINFDCTSKVSRKAKRRKKNWYPKKRKCKSKNMSYNKHCTVPNALLNEEVYCNTCDEESQEPIDFSTSLSSMKMNENIESTQKFDNKTVSLINMPIGSSSVTDCQHNDTKSERTVDFHSTLSGIEKVENIKIMIEPCKELQVKAAHPITDPIDASLNVDKRRSNTKKKRKRCIWDTKKRRCKNRKSSQTKNIEIVESVILCDTCDESETDELTGNNCQILRSPELGKETFTPSSNSHCQLNIYTTPMTQDVEPKSNNKVLNDTHNFDERDDLTENNGEILQISVSEEKETLKTSSHSCNQLNSFDIPQSSKTKYTKVVEPILNPEILDNADNRENLINGNHENSRPVELDREIFETRPDSCKFHSVSSGHTPETSSSSNIDKISNLSLNGVLSLESINLMEDDLDFEPDPFDHTSVEIPSECSVDNTCTDVSVKTPVSSEIIISASNNSFDKNNDFELISEPNLKVCNDFHSVTPKNSSFGLPKPSNSLSYLNFDRSDDAISQKRNLPSEDDSDSDHEYNFKRSRREKNGLYEDESKNSNSNNCNENGFNVHDDDSQNEVVNCEMPGNSSSENCKKNSHFSNSSRKDQDIFSHNEQNESQFCIPKQDKTLVNSSKSQVSHGNFYRLEDVVSKIKSFCNEKNVTGALQITQTYISISSNNEVNNYLMQELISSLLSLFHTNAKNINVSIATIFNEILKITEDYNIDDKIIFSKLIVECCSNKELYFNSVKVLYSCKKRNISLKTSALKVFSSFLKAEDISLNVLLNFLLYIKSVCNKKMPKDLVHMALEKCKEYKFEDVHQMCLLLHNVTFKEVDPANLQEFLFLCFKQRMWANIADMFIAWDSRHYLLECFYNALASASENIGDYFEKFADSLFNGFEGKLSSYQVYFIGQIGTALMLCSFSRRKLQCALEVLYTLHAHNINYFQQMLSTCKFYKCSKDSDTSAMAFPFHVVFIAVDICLHFKRPKDAFKIFQGFSWIQPDENIDVSVKADVINGRFQRLLKLIPFLNNEDCLTDGWEALKMLLLSAEQDFSLDDLKRYAPDMVDVYNGYLISLMNSGKISSLHDLYKHSLGHCKDVIAISCCVLRGLAVTFAEKGMLQDAKSVLMLGIIKKIYSIKKPEPDTFPWQLTIRTNWNVFEIKLAVEWFLDGLLPILTDKPGKTDYEKWFSLKIHFKVSNLVSSKEINCLKEIAIDPLNAIKRAGEALQLLNPSLEFIQETAENILCITPDSLYNYWIYNCPSASHKVAVFSNQQPVKKSLSFGKECGISEGKSISSLDGFKEESQNLIKHSPNFARNLHLQSHVAEFDNESDYAKNIVHVTTDEIKANILESPVTSVTYQNTSSVVTDPGSFKMPLEEPPKWQTYSSNDAAMQSKFETLPVSSCFQISTPFKLSYADESGINNLNSLEKFDSPNMLMQNQHSESSFINLSSRAELSRSENHFKNINSNPTNLPLVVCHPSNSSTIEAALKISPVKSTNHMNNVYNPMKSNTVEKRPPIKFVRNRQNTLEKSKLDQSSIEELSNFHVVKISSTKCSSIDKKVLSSNQERAQVESTEKLIKKRRKKLLNLTASPSSGNKSSGELNIKLSKKARKFNKKQKFQNFTISLTPNTSERTISQYASQPSNSNMPSTSKNFCNEITDVPQTQSLSTENVFSTNASASMQMSKGVVVSLKRNIKPDTISKCISQPSNQNAHLSSQMVTNDEHNIAFQSKNSKYNTNIDASHSSVSGKNISKGKISLVRNAVSNTISESVSLPSTQNICSTPQIVLNKKSSIISLTKCVSLRDSSHSSPEKNVPSADDVSLRQPETVKISLVQNAASNTMSNRVSFPSNQNKLLTSQIVIDEKLCISQKQNTNSNTSCTSKLGKNLFSTNMCASQQPSKANRISLIRYVAPMKSNVVNKCAFELSNQKSDVLQQVETVPNSNACHAPTSVKLISLSGASPSLQQSKADESSCIRISTTGNSSCRTEEHKKIIQFLNIKVAQKHKNLSSDEQHQQAVALAETFMKDNSIATMDKKVMKLLTEFAVNRV